MRWFQPGQKRIQVFLARCAEPEQALQVDDRPLPEALELTFRVAEVARVADAVLYQFSLFTFDGAAQPVAVLELVGLLAWPGRMQVGFVRVRLHGPSGHLALDTALEQRADFAGRPRKGELQRGLAVLGWPGLPVTVCPCGQVAVCCLQVNLKGRLVDRRVWRAA